MSDINFISYEDAQNLVERISDRCETFHYQMSFEEKEAMASLLSDCGVATSDLINVSNLADNYAVNAEIVKGSEADDYDEHILRDALFSWEEGGERYYCIRW